VRKSDGSIDYIIAVVEDISARKQAEDELRQSEEQFRSSLLLSPLPILVCTENLNPGVAVMESAQNGKRCDAPGPLNRARDQRIFIQ
jgi:PAS domain-containing protein